MSRRTSRRNAKQVVASWIWNQTARPSVQQPTPPAKYAQHLAILQAAESLDRRRHRGCKPCEWRARPHVCTRRDSTPTPTTLSGTIYGVAARCQTCSRGRGAGCASVRTLKPFRALQRVARFARGLQSALENKRLQCGLIVGICARGRVERGASLRGRLAPFFGKAKRCLRKCLSGAATHHARHSAEPTRRAPRGEASRRLPSRWSGARSAEVRAARGRDAGRDGKRRATAGRARARPDADGLRRDGNGGSAGRRKPLTGRAYSD